jgi:hypothetical protein
MRKLRGFEPHLQQSFLFATRPKMTPLLMCVEMALCS